MSQTTSPLPPCPDLSRLYPSDALTALDRAQALVSDMGGVLRDDRLKASLAELVRLGGELATHMGRHLGPLCARCAQNPKGGCCSRVMADESDAVLLSMNLLAGVVVRVHRDNGRDCLFLGETGCSLAFKPIFCINYDCQLITNGCAPEALQRYQHLRGRLLQEQWRVEQEILSRLRPEQA